MGGDQERRNLILVGHDVGGDVQYLRSIGYDINNLLNLQEIVDTTRMFRYLKREINLRNLGNVLGDLGISGWNLHNAGNDAVYTLQAMLGIALKHLDAKASKEKTQLYREKRINQYAPGFIILWQDWLRLL